MTVCTTDPITAAAAAVQTALHLRGVCKVFDRRPVLDQISFDVAAGAFVALLGANGAGKSTLLRVLATLVPRSGGEMRLFGAPLRPQNPSCRLRLGLIGHASMLYRDLSARENLVFFARLYGVPDPDGRARALLAGAGLEARADDPVKTFSRGMVQRVAIARALVHDPALLLADEPFAGLDARARGVLEDTLRRLNREGRTVLLASHDIEQSLALADQVLVLRRGRLALDRPARELDPPTVLREVTAS